MVHPDEFAWLVERLTPRYGRGEARSVARIVWEDAFDRGRKYDGARFSEIAERLESGEPVQYVLGEADFWGLKFRVTPAVLIPRQETEELVAWVLEHLARCPADWPQQWLDIGLGSGCIAVTLQKKALNAHVLGFEKSPEALAVAQENARRILGKEMPCFLGDILDRRSWAAVPPLDGIVSNPPYIPESERSLVPEHVAAHEPALALFVEGADGLLFYRHIAAFALEKLRPGGALFLECNEFNAPEAAALLREMGFTAVELRKDLSGAERMLRGRLPA